MHSRPNGTFALLSKSPISARKVSKKSLFPFIWTENRTTLYPTLLSPCTEPFIKNQFHNYQRLSFYS